MQCRANVKVKTKIHVGVNNVNNITTIGIKNVNVKVNEINLN